MDGHVDSGGGPTPDSETWTAATIAPRDCGPKKPEPGQHLLQPYPRKLRSIALAEVLMKLTESCVIEQHIDRLLESVEPTNLELGTPGAAALIVPMVRGWAIDMAGAPKVGQDGDGVLAIDLENAYGRAFRSTSFEAACSDVRGAVGALRHKVLAAMGRWLDSGQHDKRRLAGFPSRASYVCARGWSLQSPSRTRWRRGLQSAAALSRSWSTMMSRAPWPMRVLGLDSSRTRSCRQRFATFA